MANTNTEQFPIVDISYATQDDNKDVVLKNDPEMNKVCQEVKDGFAEWGFIYVKGHGISQELIDSMFGQSKEFFQQPLEKKNEILMDTEDTNYIIGYVPYKLETFNAGKPYDLKEALDYRTNIKPAMKEKFPAQLLSTYQQFFKECKQLLGILLKVLEKALAIEEPELFTSGHKKVGELGNTTMLRSLYYPAIGDAEILPEQIRCGEHSDYGSLTFLFQNADGLEVMSPSGKYIRVKVIPGTIVVNVADLLERWTSGRLKSSKHRVTLPTDKTVPRQSVAFFGIPDNELVVKCYDGSDKYEAVKAFDYIDMRYKQTLNIV